MEPVDPRMGELLGGASGGGPDELRSIVSRAGRARTRVAAVAAGLALAAGGGLGYGVSSATSGGSQQIVATAPQSAGAGSSQASGVQSPAGAPAVAVPNPSIAQALKYQKVFTRQVGSVDIRGFLQSAPAVPSGVPTICVAGGGWTRFQADVSTPGMVGIVFAMDYQQSAAGGPIEFTQPQVVGSAEGDPVAVVVAHTSSDVAQVKMDFAGHGSDQMAPVQGWSVLATPYPGGTFTSPVTFGTLIALDKSGHTLAQQIVQVGTRPLPGLPMNPGKSPPNGSGGSGSGSAGSGSGSVGSGSGSVGSGSGSVGTGSGSAGASSGPVGAGSGSVGGGSSSSGTATSPPASSNPPVSAASPPATTSPGLRPVPGTTVYPCEVTPLPAQVPPASTSANTGSGG